MRRRIRFLIPPLLAILATAWVQLYYKHEHGAQGYGTAQIGDHFTLTDTKGKIATDDTFRGKPMLVYMGYSQCPDICPITLATMSDTLKLLGPDADKTAFVFITLDPEHDTPEVLGAYLAHFDKRIIGLTGSRQTIEQLAQDYKIAVNRNKVAATGKTLIGHSGLLFLMNAKGTYVMHFDTDAKPAELAAAIKKLI